MPSIWSQFPSSSWDKFTQPRSHPRNHWKKRRKQTKQTPRHHPTLATPATAKAPPDLWWCHRLRCVSAQRVAGTTGEDARRGRSWYESMAPIPMMSNFISFSDFVLMIKTIIHQDIRGFFWLSRSVQSVAKGRTHTINVSLGLLHKNLTLPNLNFGISISTPNQALKKQIVPKVWFPKVTKCHLSLSRITSFFLILAPIRWIFSGPPFVGDVGKARQSVSRSLSCWSHSVWNFFWSDVQLRPAGDENPGVKSDKMLHDSRYSQSSRKKSHFLKTAWVPKTTRTWIKGLERLWSFLLKILFFRCVFTVFPQKKNSKKNLAF